MYRFIFMTSRTFSSLPIYDFPHASVLRGARSGILMAMLLVEKEDCRRSAPLAIISHARRNRKKSSFGCLRPPILTRGAAPVDFTTHARRLISRSRRASIISARSAFFSGRHLRAAGIDTPRCCHARLPPFRRKVRRRAIRKRRRVGCHLPSAFRFLRGRYRTGQFTLAQSHKHDESADRKRANEMPVTTNK